uniref:Uncharacterized protein n=1 Tax=Brassica campestris TaxID=3711 RepID=A0A3P5ZKG8_BRACM|nr:unnamed protein product [Brassica rapa]
MVKIFSPSFAITGPEWSRLVLLVMMLQELYSQVSLAVHVTRE